MRMMAGASRRTCAGGDGVSSIGRRRSRHSSCLSGLACQLRTFPTPPKSQAGPAPAAYWAPPKADHPNVVLESRFPVTGALFRHLYA
jgi:hypothetical protein